LTLRVYTTPVVVLHRINLGEHDKILTLCTLERGKLNAVAKGARKPISKLAGATELFTHSRVQLAVGRSLDVITQAEIADSFQGIRNDLTRIAHASLMTELVDRFTEERDPHPQLFWLLVNTLRALEQSAHPDLVTHCFEMHLLSEVGYRPHLVDCAICGTEIRADPAPFSPALGGVLCPAHRRRSADTLPAGQGTLSLGRTLLHIPPSREDALAALADHASPEIRRGLERILRAHMQYRLERPLKSPDFIREVTALYAPRSNGG
jgi:DNA repair protein RecO (recombination protein O)